MLFKLVELPSDEPVQFVGVYVLRWGCVEAPTVAFREATPEEIAAEQSVPLTSGVARAVGLFTTSLYAKTCRRTKRASES